MAASTILIRCVDPRFEGEWATAIQKAIGPHYSLTVFGGFDTLDEEGFQELARQVQELLKMDSTIQRIIVSFHTTCAWCMAQRIGEGAQLSRARILQTRLAKTIYPRMEVFVGKVVEGWMTFV